eukprot:CAMPEP_0114593504 /NCGR_PEP_ID=MMETSP0125-20121206/15099_1 /TAXON_ID=485358 ORGANISM="Aristerostoma sp., Strain ATCC 50986" /NCGR_SAMPLE_ID=MMETSP0125 /ASSEMBLY_ACC=CAM_ASM_000245 /LENGTH=68 /DNA_ID=CAMNT_0001792751 /DNA_START=976 /DNA_END=1182 /DNA_ORIENTATION=-
MTDGRIEPDDSPFFKIARGYYEASKLKRKLNDVPKDDAYKVYVSSGESDVDIHIIKDSKPVEETSKKF